jgi:hypothetical protein
MDDHILNPIGQNSRMEPEENEIEENQDFGESLVPATASNRDSADVVYFSVYIFNMRCSTKASTLSNLLVTESLLDQLKVVSVLFHNPGSYPTLFNELDGFS